MSYSNDNISGSNIFFLCNVDGGDQNIVFSHSSVAGPIPTRTNYNLSCSTSSRVDEATNDDGNIVQTTVVTTSCSCNSFTESYPGAWPPCPLSTAVLKSGGYDGIAKWCYHDGSGGNFCSTIVTVEVVNVRDAVPESGEVCISTLKDSVWIKDPLAPSAKGNCISDYKDHSTKIRFRIPRSGTSLTPINSPVCSPETFRNVAGAKTTVELGITLDPQNLQSELPQSLSIEPRLGIGDPFGGGFIAGLISHTADGIPTHVLIVAPKQFAIGPGYYDLSNSSFSSFAGRGFYGLPFYRSVQGSDISSWFNYSSWNLLNFRNPLVLRSAYDGAAGVEIIYSLGQELGSSGWRPDNFAAVSYATSLNIGGFRDWYLPSYWELDIAYAHLKPTLDLSAARPRQNPYMVSPLIAGYRGVLREQTIIERFQRGEPESFTADYQDFIFQFSGTPPEPAGLHLTYPVGFDAGAFTPEFSRTNPGSVLATAIYFKDGSTTSNTTVISGNGFTQVVPTSFSSMESPLSVRPFRKVPFTSQIFS